MLRDQMAGALKLRALNPARLEPEPVQRGAKDGANLADAGEVLRPTVDVDDALEQRQRLGVVRVDVCAAIARSAAGAPACRANTTARAKPIVRIIDPR